MPTIPNPDHVQTLVDMGFPVEHVKYALRKMVRVVLSFRFMLRSMSIAASAYEPRFARLCGTVTHLLFQTFSYQVQNTQNLTRQNHNLQKFQICTTWDRVISHFVIGRFKTCNLANRVVNLVFSIFGILLHFTRPKVEMLHAPVNWFHIGRNLVTPFLPGLPKLNCSQPQKTRQRVMASLTNSLNLQIYV